MPGGGGADDRIKRMIEAIPELVKDLGAWTEPAPIGTAATDASDGGTPVCTALTEGDGNAADVAHKVAKVLQQVVDEVTARNALRDEWLRPVLKAVELVAKNHPIVTKRGDASVVLPLLARVFPMLARPRGAPSGTDGGSQGSADDAHTAAIEAADALLEGMRQGDEEVYEAAIEDVVEMICALPAIAEQVVHPMPPQGSRERAVASAAMSSPTFTCLQASADALHKRTGMPTSQTQPTASSKDAAQERANAAAEQAEEAGVDFEDAIMAMMTAAESAMAEADMVMSAGPPPASAEIEIPTPGHWSQLTVAAVTLLDRMVGRARGHSKAAFQPGVAALAQLVSVGDMAVNEACFRAVPSALVVVEGEEADALAVALTGAAVLSLQQGYASAALPAFRTQAFDHAVATCLNATMKHDAAISAHGAGVLSALPWAAAASPSASLARALCVGASLALGSDDGDKFSHRALGLLPLLRCGAHGAHGMHTAQAMTEALTVALRRPRHEREGGDFAGRSADASKQQAKRARVEGPRDLHGAMLKRVNELVLVERSYLVARGSIDFPGELLELAVLGEAAIAAADATTSAAVAAATSRWCEEASRLASSGGTPCARRTATLLVLAKNVAGGAAQSESGRSDANIAAIIRTMPALAEAVLSGGVGVPAAPTVDPPSGCDDPLAALSRGASSLSIANGAARLIWSVAQAKAVEAAKVVAVAALCTVNPAGAEHAMNVALRDRSSAVKGAAVVMAISGWAHAATSGGRGLQRREALLAKLQRLTADESPDVRAAVARTLPSWAPAPAQWGSLVTHLLSDKCASVQLACASSLSELLKESKPQDMASSPEACKAAMRLVDLMHSQDPALRKKAAATCARLAQDKLVVVLRPSQYQKGSPGGRLDGPADVGQEQVALVECLRRSLDRCDDEESREAHLQGMCSVGLVMLPGEPLCALVGQLILYLDGGPLGLPRLATLSAEYLKILAREKKASVASLLRSACTSPSVSREVCRTMVSEGRERLIPKLAEAQRVEGTDNAEPEQLARAVVKRLAPAYLPRLVEEGGQGDAIALELLPIFAACDAPEGSPPVDIAGLLDKNLPAIASYLLMRSQAPEDAFVFLGKQLPGDEDDAEKALDLMKYRLESIIMHLIWSLGELHNPTALRSDVVDNLEPTIELLVDLLNIDTDRILRKHPASQLLDDASLFGEDACASQRSLESSRSDGPENKRHRRALTAAMLAEHFLSLWVQLERKYSLQPAQRIRALRCACALVGLVSGHIRPFASKVLIFFTAVLEREGQEEHALRALRMLTAALGKCAPSKLSTLASQIVVALLAPLERAEAGSYEEKLAVEVLEELLIRQGEHIGNAVQEMPELPAKPALEAARSALLEARGAPGSLASRLRQLVGGLGHDSASVRACILAEVREQLIERRNEVCHLARRNDASIHHLVAALLRCMGDHAGSAGVRRGRVDAAAEATMLTCAECLGLVGAISKQQMARVALKSQPWMELAPVDFLAELIEKHLARFLRAGQAPLVVSSASYATQTIFNITGLREGDGASFSGSNASTRRTRTESARDTAQEDISACGRTLWDKLSSDAREIVSPCRSSRYKLSQRPLIDNAPVFNEGTSYLAWLHAWYCSLLPYVSGDWMLVFEALSPMVKLDSRAALFVLPQLALAVLTGARADEARAALSTEIQTVLGSCADGGSDVAAVAAEAVFHLWDGLLRWVEHQRKTGGRAPPRGGAISTSGSRPGEQRTSIAGELLGDVPNLLLAKASLRCGAPARALMYAELHVRGVFGSNNPSAARGGVHKSGIAGPGDISLLAQIQASLEEPDGLRGAAALRRAAGAQSTDGSEEAEEALLLAEAEGHWSDAALLCEAALARTPDNPTYRARLLKCMLHAGRHHSVLAQAEGLAAMCAPADVQGNWGASFGECAVAAAWKLGQWETLERQVSRNDAPDSFETSIGSGVLAVHKRDRAAVDRAAQHGRSAMCMRLAAAAMESYDRAYPYLIRLHMMQEVVDGCEMARGIDACMDGLSIGTAPAPARVQEKVDLIELPFHWKDRLAITEDALNTRYPMLALRGRLLHESGRFYRAAETWLAAAKLARKASRKDVARAALLEVDTMRRAALCDKAHGTVDVEALGGIAAIEGAKLAWSSGRAVEAASMLEGWLARSPDASHRSLAAAAAATADIAGTSVKDAGQYRTPSRGSGAVDSKALLLLARWSAATGQRDSRGVTDLLNAAQKAQPNAETAAFEIATYRDDLLRDARARQTNAYSVVGPTTKEVAGLTKHDKHWAQALPEVIDWYCRSLTNGCKHIGRSLPRVLTLWLDWAAHGERKYASEVHGVQHMSTKEARNVAQKLLRSVQQLAKSAPAYYWLTVLPTLGSRVSHPDNSAAAQVQSILARVLATYPHQSLWSIAQLSKSDVAARKDGAQRAITDAKRSIAADDTKALFGQFTQLVDQLIRLCNQAPPKNPQNGRRVPHFSAKDLVPGLPHLLPVGVIVPVQQVLQPMMPASVSGLKPPRDAGSSRIGARGGRANGSNSGFSPFLEAPKITGMRDKVDVMSSMQAPKKVTLLGSDGKEWAFLAKPKDDLRKDARMMEFAGLLNVLLHRDEASRRRGLQLTTFAVLPLTDDCGLIQWVPNTQGIRHVMSDAYGYIGKPMSNKELSKIKKEYDSIAQRGLTKTAWLRSEMLPRYPPQLHRFFMRNWPEPSAWLAARQAFARSLAAWSMAGHAVGLGDRHGENILLNVASGTIVHVDFAMLFDKGLELETPERVPFRLTQGLVDALGVEGPQGAFLRASVATLGTLRSHKEEIVNVLETFVHDPLVEWAGKGKNHSSSGTSSLTNAKAKAIMSNISARLDGKVVGVGAAPSLPLSEEGQAQRLISDATSLENLSRMYIWWMPWM